MRARVVFAEFGIPRATVILTDDNGKNRSYIVQLRDWRSVEGELYYLLNECLEISNPDARDAINKALLEFQEYGIPWANPGHAPE